MATGKEFWKTDKLAPVQGDRGGHIPWDLHVNAWTVYAACGHRSQSAKRIAERGGFGYLELCLMLDFRDPWSSGCKPLSEANKAFALRLREEGIEE